jgi:hypothetical protein
MFFSYLQGYLGYLLYSEEENKLVYRIKIFIPYVLAPLRSPMTKYR